MLPLLLLSIWIKRLADSIPTFYSEAQNKYKWQDQNNYSDTETRCIVWVIFGEEGAAGGKRPSWCLLLGYTWLLPLLVSIIWIKNKDFFWKYRFAVKINTTDFCQGWSRCWWKKTILLSPSWFHLAPAPAGLVWSLPPLITVHCNTPFYYGMELILMLATVAQES